MRILITPDKFKGSLTSQQVCDAVASAFSDKHPEWSIEKFPLADGGEGTGEILTSICGGKKVKANARDPLFREIETFYGLSPDGKTAFIEMASASGLQLLKPDERNPLLTSSIGTGDLIRHALKNGVTSIIIGCGGSATNDAGIGMASALGFSFLDSHGETILPTGENLLKIKSIDSSSVLAEIQSCKFLVITDVDNPLYGSKGAAFTFAPQKGATPENVVRLDHGLRNFAQVVEGCFQQGIGNFPGAGAAGGFPVSARAFLKSGMRSGIEYIMEFAGLEEKVKNSDWVISGEGKFDDQSLHGKVVSGVAQLCRKFNKRFWIVCGVSEMQESVYKRMGIEKVLAISSSASSLDDSMERAAFLIQKEIQKNI